MACPNCGNTEYLSVPSACAGEDYSPGWNSQLRLLPGPVETEADTHDSVLRLREMQLFIYGSRTGESRRPLVPSRPPPRAAWMRFP